MTTIKSVLLSLNMDSTFLRLFFILLGGATLLAGCNKLYIYLDFRVSGVEAYGTIEHPATTTVLGGRPLIQYRDAAGIAHEFRSKAKTHWFGKPQQGEIMSVIYEEESSQRAIVNNLLYYVIGPLGFVVVGCFFILKAICIKNDCSFHQKPHGLRDIKI